MLLKVDALSSGYGSREVIKNMSIYINPGEIVCILGANGAGKTTFIRTMMGYIPTNAGTITFEDRLMNGLPPNEVAKLGISYVPQGDLVFQDLTVAENLRMGAFLEKDKSEYAKSLDRVYEFFPRIEERISQKAGTLSGGERQMLGVGMALMSYTKLLFLDEPSFGLAPIMIDNIFDKLAELNKSGITILIAEQNVVSTLEIANRGYVIELGRIEHEDTAQNLVNNDEVKKAYLGG